MPIRVRAAPAVCHSPATPAVSMEPGALSCCCCCAAGLPDTPVRVLLLHVQVGADGPDPHQAQRGGGAALQHPGAPDCQGGQLPQVLRAGRAWRGRLQLRQLVFMLAVVGYGTAQGLGGRSTALQPCSILSLRRSRGPHASEQAVHAVLCSSCLRYSSCCAQAQTYLTAEHVDSVKTAKHH